MPFVIGVDLGGTKFAVCAMTTDGAEQHAFTSDPTLAERGADDIVARIGARVLDVMARTTAETG